MGMISFRRDMSYWGCSLPDPLLFSWDALLGRAVWVFGLLSGPHLSQNMMGSRLRKSGDDLSPSLVEPQEEDEVEEDRAEEEDEERRWESAALPLDAWPALQERTGLVYDEKMMSHCNLWDKYVLRGRGRVRGIPHLSH